MGTIHNLLKMIGLHPRFHKHHGGSERQGNARRSCAVERVQVAVIKGVE